MKRLIFIGVVAFAMLNCGTKSTKNDDKGHFSQKNIDICAKLLVDSVGIDLELAREKCKCMMEAYLSIDTNYKNMSGEEAVAFGNLHWRQVDSMCNMSSLRESKNK